MTPKWTGWDGYISNTTPAKSTAHNYNNDNKASCHLQRAILSRGDHVEVLVVLGGNCIIIVVVIIINSIIIIIVIIIVVINIKEVTRFLWFCK